jgi:hypothetical protein
MRETMRRTAASRLSCFCQPRRFNFGSITTDYPAFLETSQVGVAEGAIEACGARAEIDVDLHDLANGDLDVRWT